MPARPLFVTRKYPPSIGGMETLAEALWQSLHHAAPQARLVAHRGGNRRLPLWLPGAVLRVAWLVIGRRADLVIAGDALMYTILSPLLRIARVPRVTMVHGLDMTYDNRLYRAMVYPVLRRAPRVIANSAATADVARGVGIPAERIAVVRLGLAVAATTTDDRVAAAADLRGRFALAPDTVVALTLGRLVERKGVRWLVENVLASLPDHVVYLVAGDGPEREPIRAAAAANGLADRVRLLGMVDDDERELLLRGADLFVQPNIRVCGDMEGFGLVVIEAALRGTPVVASGLEGLLDAVEDATSGILLPPGEPQAWIDRLRELTADREELLLAGAKFQARAQELYSLDQMSHHLTTELGMDTTRP